MSLPKWNEERENTLTALVNGESPVSTETVKHIAEEMETSERSVASKLRKMGVEVDKKADAAPAFDEAQTEQLRGIVDANPGAFTAQEVADQLGADFSLKQIRGKLLSMDLAGALKHVEPVAIPRKYTPEQEARIVDMVQGGSFVEDIAAEMDKTVQQIRGKCLSLLREVDGLTMPETRDKVGKTETANPYEGLDLKTLSVADISEATNKTERAVKTYLTKSGINCANYKGATRRERLDKKAA